jgi:hypothetical protein
MRGLHQLVSFKWRHPERSRFSGGAKDLGLLCCRGVFTAAALLALTLATACRLDMQVQPRQNPLSHSDFFADQRSERPPVEGTIARGQLHEDAYFYTGKIGGNPGDAMPFPVTKEVLERGRERYNIYCAPCHSRVGDGNGFVPSRGFPRKPPSFHIERLQKAPIGYMYDVITEGFGIMPDYASQIPVRDRWDIVAYVKALQLSQNATKADVPAGQSVPSSAPRFELGTGASLPVVVPESEEVEGQSAAGSRMPPPKSEAMSPETKKAESEQRKNQKKEDQK